MDETKAEEAVGIDENVVACDDKDGGIVKEEPNSTSSGDKNDKKHKKKNEIDHLLEDALNGMISLQSVSVGSTTSSHKRPFSGGIPSKKKGLHGKNHSSPKKKAKMQKQKSPSKSASNEATNFAPSSIEDDPTSSPAALPEFAQALGAKLAHALENKYYYNWCAFEHFYSTIDRGILKQDIMKELIAKHFPGLNLEAAPRVVWLYIRQKLRCSLRLVDNKIKNIRFSPNFILQEKIKLASQRAVICHLHRGVPLENIRSDAIPQKAPLPFHVGSSVLVCDDTQNVRPGRVMATDPDTNCYWVEIGKERELVIAHTLDIASRDPVIFVESSRLSDSSKLAQEQQSVSVTPSGYGSEKYRSKLRMKLEMDDFQVGGEKICELVRDRIHLKSTGLFRFPQQSHPTSEEMINAFIKEVDEALDVILKRKYNVCMLMTIFEKCLQVQRALVTASSQLPRVIMAKGEGAAEKCDEAKILRWVLHSMNLVQSRIRLLSKKLSCVAILDNDTVSSSPIDNPFAPFLVQLNNDGSAADASMTATTTTTTK
eukprot:m.41020 g.41020  ORF g.41020 m.41020 type:complete len:541 (-) comp6971_c1_seq2:1944-3566(-)